MTDDQPLFRRVVTGVNDAGRSIVAADGPSPRSLGASGEAGIRTAEMWSTLRGGEGAADRDGALDHAGLEPPPGGTVFRLVEFPPDADYLDREWDGAAAWTALGGRELLEDEATAVRSRTRPGFHRTSSVDYVVIVSGQIFAVLDDGEVELSPGDCLIQRGTYHAWSNRSDEPCVLAVVLVDEEDPSETAKGCV